MFNRGDLTSLRVPGIRAILDETSQINRIWLGPNGHAVLYPVQGHQIFNLVLIVTDGELNAAEGSHLNRARAFCANWDPV